MEGGEGPPHGPRHWGNRRGGTENRKGDWGTEQTTGSSHGVETFEEQNMPWGLSGADFQLKVDDQSFGHISPKNHSKHHPSTEKGMPGTERRRGGKSPS